MDCHVKILVLLKFDLLGLETLRMIENTIMLILKKSGVENPKFDDIKKWFTEYMD